MARSHGPTHSPSLARSRSHSLWLTPWARSQPEQATVTLEAQAVDAKRATAVFYAVFAGVSDYVYSLKFDPGTCKIAAMTKIWNDGYAKAHIPPAA